jgi:hypothetical protein
VYDTLALAAERNEEMQRVYCLMPVLPGEFLLWVSLSNLNGMFLLVSFLQKRRDLRRAFHFKSCDRNLCQV